MKMQYTGKCCRCREKIDAGADALGAKIGGAWDFLCQTCTISLSWSWRDFKKWREASLLSLCDETGLDHEDYYLMEESDAIH